jgi:hypothetical protein
MYKMRKINKKSGSVHQTCKSYLLAHWVESTTPFRKPIIEFMAPKTQLGGNKMGGDLYQ